MRPSPSPRPMARSVPVGRHGRRAPIRGHRPSRRAQSPDDDGVPDRNAEQRGHLRQSVRPVHDRTVVRAIDFAMQRRTLGPVKYEGRTDGRGCGRVTERSSGCSQSRSSDGFPAKHGLAGTDDRGCRFLRDLNDDPEQYGIGDGRRRLTIANGEMVPGTFDGVAGACSNASVTPWVARSGVPPPTGLSSLISGTRQRTLADWQFIASSSAEAPADTARPDGDFVKIGYLAAESRNTPRARTGSRPSTPAGIRSSRGQAAVDCARG